MRRIPSLDGLRAVSILLVVVGHWAELRYKSDVVISDVAGSFANLGVRIFFVISGYLITTLLLKEQAQNIDDSAAGILCAARVPDSSGGHVLYAAGVCDFPA